LVSALSRLPCGKPENRCGRRFTTPLRASVDIGMASSERFLLAERDEPRHL
jgi:hypothetical protein